MHFSLIRVFVIVTSTLLVVGTANSQEARKECTFTKVYHIKGISAPTRCIDLPIGENHHSIFVEYGGRLIYKYCSISYSFRDNKTGEQKVIGDFKPKNVFDNQRKIYEGHVFTHTEDNIKYRITTLSCPSNNFNIPQVYVEIQQDYSSDLEMCPIDIEPMESNLFKINIFGTPKIEYIEQWQEQLVNSGAVLNLQYSVTKSEQLSFNDTESISKIAGFDLKALGASVATEIAASTGQDFTQSETLGMSTAFTGDTCDKWNYRRYKVVQEGRITSINDSQSQSFPFQFVTNVGIETKHQCSEIE